MGERKISERLSVTAPKGFLAGTAQCGLKKVGDDLAIIFSERPAAAAAVFTQNLVQAAPVLVSREHLRFKTHRAIVVNSGGANACTGDPGLNDARATARMVAEYFNCDERGVREATGRLSREAGFHVAEAIMTTDTRPKRAARSVRLGARVVKIAGVAKGSGMIHPDMATLLSFVTTDAAIGKAALRRALKLAVDRSFNRVSVDGDTSTNDMLAVLANGAAGNEPITTPGGADFELFAETLTEVCRDLAIQVARDGEGARKLITIRIRRAPNERDAAIIAATIGASLLVKTAIAGADANWGRILAAAGRSGVKFDPSKIEIKLGDLAVARRGMGLPFNEARALEILKRDEVTVTFDMRQGEAETTEWTCDLTEDYVHINADYRS